MGMQVPGIIERLDSGRDKFNKSGVLLKLSYTTSGKHKL